MKRAVVVFGCDVDGDVVVTGDVVTSVCGTVVSKVVGKTVVTAHEHSI